MTARIFTLTLPLADLHSSNDRGHWSIEAKKRKLMRKAARSAAVDLTPITGKASLLILFAFGDKRLRDLDNISAKGGIDGAVDAGLISDDRATVLRPVARDLGGGVAPKGFAVLTFAFSPVQEGIRE